ncbi:MAG: hypothetical protein K2F58_01040 [Muribaculaceae bacterium]|nr:hypothetical protein [Muribaculaceae bacterium]
MKKLLLMAVAAATTLGAAAANLWTGSCTFSNYKAEVPEDRPVLPAALFASAQVGDDIVVTLTNNPNDKQSWHQCELWTPNVADGDPNATALCQGVHITEGMTSAVFSINEDMLSKLQSTGCALAGTGYTVTSIDLTGFDPVIWQGESVVANWNATPAVNLPGAKFAGVAQGLELVFEVHIITPGEWAGIQIDKSTYVAGSFGAVDIGDKTSEISFVLTPALHAELQADGINITGANFVLTKIYVREVQGEGSTIWTGECVVKEWNADPTVNLPGAKFSEVAEGDELVFDVRIITPGEYACIQIDKSTWTPGAFGTTEIGDETSEVSFVLTPALHAELLADGINITGMNFVLTRIYVRAAAGADGPEVWSGSLSTGDWAQYLEIEPSRCTEINAGDELVFTVTATGAEASMCLKQRLASGWEEMPADEEWGNYIDLPEGESEAVFAVNEEAAATIKANGFVVAGKDFTVTKIVCRHEGDSASRAIVRAAAGSGEVYDLRGRRVNASAALPAGIYIVDGKKILKR